MNDLMGAFGDEEELEKMTAAEATPAQNIIPEQDEVCETGPDPEDKAHEITGPVPIDMPFRLLGHNNGSFFIKPHGTEQVFECPGSKLTKLTLLQIAPLRWWELNYGGQHGVNWTAAANFIMRVAEKIGVFDPSKRRGKGAWQEKDGIILHLGDKLAKNGKILSIRDYNGPFIYETATPLEYDITCTPSSNEEANKLLAITKMLPWEDPKSAYYLAGWLVLSIIAGILEWRPHLWLTGGKGTGKSYIVEKIVMRILGSFGKLFEGCSTEAGLRQSFSLDALACVLDEAEAESPIGQHRLQLVLDLARQSSSNSSGRIVKGTQNGRAMEFFIRSIFFLASISVSLIKAADKSRFTVLSLQKIIGITAEQRVEHFKKLNDLILNTLTPEWCNGFRARAIKNADTIKKNAHAFALGLAEILDSQRSGDQYGVLLAGAFSLTSERLVDLAFVRSWLREQNFERERESNEDSDEYRCLMAILHHELLLDDKKKRQVSELLVICDSSRPIDFDENTTGEISDKDADKVLKRIGIKFERIEAGKSVLISNSHDAIKRMLIDTPWAECWARSLQRLEGAMHVNTSRFLYSVTRATRIPWEIIFRDNL
jgi:putative DNA primase/helicase